MLRRTLLWLEGVKAAVETRWTVGDIFGSGELEDPGDSDLGDVCLVGAGAALDGGVKGEDCL